MSAMHPWRQLVASPEQIALGDEALRRVARYCSVSLEAAAQLEAAIRAHKREPSVVLARHLVFAVLQGAGLNPAEIARVLGLNHSTIIHGLEQMRVRPERRAQFEALAAILPATLRPPGACSLDEAIRVACADQRPALTTTDADHVTAYVAVDLLGKPPPLLDRLAPYYGRRLVSERPDLDAEVGRIVDRFKDMAAAPRPVLLPPARVSYPLRGLEVIR